MSRTPFFMALPILIWAGPMQAQDQLPRYNVEKHCDDIAAYGDTYSSEMFNFCITSEQSAYDVLKSDWSGYSQRVRNHCDQIARFGGPGSYEMLKFCVDEESDAESNRQTFTFD